MTSHLSSFYGLVTDKTTSMPQVLTVPMLTYKDSPINAYPRLLAMISDQYQGKYQSSGLSFGALKITYFSSKREGTVHIGHTKVGFITPRPTIMSTAVELIAGQPLYFTATLGINNDTMNTQYRDVISCHLPAAVWSIM